MTIYGKLVQIIIISFWEEEIGVVLAVSDRLDIAAWTAVCRVQPRRRIAVDVHHALVLLRGGEPNIDR